LKNLQSKFQGKDINQAKDKKELVVCQKISDASGSVLIDCTDNPEEKRRESDSSGYLILTEPESVIILPLKNSTGQKELDWLSMGLWDVLSVKLGYVWSLRVMRIRDYIMKARRPPGELAGYGHEKAIELARGMSAKQVWAGKFREDAKGNIEIELVGYNVKSGTEVFREKFRSSLSTLPVRIDFMIKKILVELKVRQKKNVLSKMESKYVDTLKAWEYNALGYEKLLLALLTAEGEKLDRLIEESIELHLTSVSVTPNYASGWASLGWALLEQGNTEEAMEAFQRSIKIKPFFIEGNMGMGYAFWEEDNIGEAVPFMKAAMRQNPFIEWSREDMKKIALKLSASLNSRRRSHMSGVQVIGH
jgi:tetratricopeptide (TPR) repeat protein